jgi:hypothetical protein
MNAKRGKGEAAGSLEVDRMIDEIVTRRPAVQPPYRSAAGSLSSDQALVTELHSLGMINWPAEDVGQRIARSVALRAGHAAPGGSADQGPAEPPPAQPRRPRRRQRWTAAVLGAAAVALLVVGPQFGPWQPWVSGRGASAPATSPPSSGTSGGSAPIPVTSPQHEKLLNGTAPGINSRFRVAGAGP